MHLNAQALDQAAMTAAIDDDCDVVARALAAMALNDFDAGFRAVRRARC
jgi:hypothetical protein